MKQSIHFWLPSAIAICCLVASSPAVAQVVSDATLPNNSSVTSEDNTNTINGGTRAGSNLFHSFEQFSVPTGGEAYFNNAVDVQNIISRVTGRAVSNIDGLIRANGSANLFLLNPSGIIFGSNASLNIGGSFVASTANSLNFADSASFSAATPQTTPLLSVSVPLGLQFGGNAGSIVNQSQATNSSGEIVGLQVQQGETLALLGGDVKLDGGILQAPGGRVELGGVAGTGTVELNVDGNDLSLSFPNGITRADVLLTSEAEIDAVANVSGSVAINAQNLYLEESSLLAGGTFANFPPLINRAGNIRLNATGKISLNNAELIAGGSNGEINIQAKSISSTDSWLNTSNFGGVAGNISVRADDSISFVRSSIGSSAGTGTSSGDINIQARAIFLTDGSAVSAYSESAEDAGSLIIHAFDSISISKSSFLAAGAGAKAKGGDINIRADGSLILTDEAEVIAQGSSDINIQARSISLTDSALDARTLGGVAGNIFVQVNDSVSLDRSSINSNAGFGESAGDINIQAKSISLTNGSNVFATATSGVSGNINLNASEFVSISGFKSLFKSLGNEGVGAILPSGLSTSVGYSAKGGNINIKTSSFSLSNFASVDTSTSGQGTAGNIDIQGRSLSVTSGAQVTTATFGQGNAGNIHLNVSDAVTLSGVTPFLGLFKDDTIQPEFIIGNRFGNPTVDTASRASGLFANTGENSTGQGGDLRITTGQLVVGDGAQVAVSSQGSGNAGELDVAASSIRLDNQAALNAETRAGQGNIFLRSEDLVLRRGSNITTNATGTATGGNITIDTDILAALGDSNITANAQDARGGRVIIDAQAIFRTADSDITASSALGTEFSGTVELNTLDVDPSRGLVSLPVVPIDTEVVQTCTPGSSQAQSKFVVTGRGGLPPNPGDALSTDAVQVDWVTLNPEAENRSSPAIFTNPTSSTPDPIVEAQGWVIGKNGSVVLTATAPNVTPHSSWYSAANCHTFQTRS